MQDVHHPRLYQVAEQEFQKTNCRLYFWHKCYKQVVSTKLLQQICMAFKLNDEQLILNSAPESKEKQTSLILEAVCQNPKLVNN